MGRGRVLYHEATLEQVHPGVWQGKCLLLDFQGPERGTEAEAAADLEQHLEDKKLVTMRDGRTSYRIEHNDGTPVLRG